MNPTGLGINFHPLAGEEIIIPNFASIHSTPTYFYLAISIRTSVKRFYNANLMALKWQ